MKAVSVVPHCAALVLAAAAATLTGCAGVQQAPDLPDVPALGAASTSGSDQVAEITGSRIPARRTDKMVSQIGSRDYKENREALAAPFRVE